MFGKLGSKISSIFSGKKLDENMLEELEELLITSDISYDTVLQLINVVKKQKFGKDVTSTDIKNILKQEMLKIIKPAENISNRPTLYKRSEKWGFSKSAATSLSFSSFNEQTYPAGLCKST